MKQQGEPVMGHEHWVGNRIRWVIALVRYHKRQREEQRHASDTTK